MTDAHEPPNPDDPRPDDPDVSTRAELLPEEAVAGSDDPEAQAEAILEESEERAAGRETTSPDHLETRTSDEVTEDLPPRS